jgi:hypothetical protein
MRALGPARADIDGMLADGACEHSPGAATTGWMVFVAAVGMMLGLLSVDLTHLKGWSEAVTPLFVGTAIGRLAAVIAAFVGGRLLPASGRGPDWKPRRMRGVRKTRRVNKGHEQTEAATEQRLTPAKGRGMFEESSPRKSPPANS